MKDFFTVFNEIVDRYPNHVAVLTDGEQPLTYQELVRSARRVAHGLKSKGVKKGDIVAIHLKKSANYIIALLGIWLSGAAFLPLSPDLPEKRKEFIVNDAKPVLIIGDHSTSNMVSIHQMRVAHTGEVLEYSSVLPDDLAYVIYTSGSTGIPKGVMVNHSGIVNMLEQQIKLFQLDATSRSLFLLSVNFDAALSDMGTALLSGATLCIEESLSNMEIARSLPEVIATRNITYIDMPPSLLNVLELRRMPQCLKTIVIGGETLAVSLVKKWAKKFRLINVYGPTEATICTSMVVCDPIAWNGPNIGFPIKGITYKIIDGELVIAGVGLARGYINQPELTKHKFFFVGGTRYYRTGDLVKKMGKNIYFIGRSDRQLKIRGRLVAPEEIEACIQSYNNVRRAGVVARGTTLIALVEFQPNKNSKSQELKKYLERFLPNWMIPHQIIMLEKIPLTSSGKIQYKELERYTHRRKVRDNNAEMMGTVAIRLTTIWEKVLKRKYIGENENFFSMGGDSLAALQVIVEAKKYGITIPVGLFAQNPTIRALVEWNKKNKRKIVSDGIPSSHFKKDALVEKGWKAFCKAGNALPHHNGALFVTGTTGFLGSHLLEALLEKTDKKIYVLVRSTHLADARKRILNSGIRYGVHVTAREMKRVIVVLGDITQPYLGMSSVDWQQLSHEVSDIYHCAASVNMVKQYKELKPPNVDSVKEIVRFALTGNKKRLNYASTLSVFVATNKNFGTVREKDDLSRTKIIYGGYAQSKWVAERFLQQISHETHSVNIFRFGLLTGDSRSGVYSDHDYLEMFVLGIIGIGSVPKGDHDSMILDVTPVDYAANAMVSISIKSSWDVFHIANKGGFTLSMILNALREQGIKIKVVSQTQWLREIRNKELNEKESAAFMALCRVMRKKKDFEQLRSMDLFQATHIVFDRTHTLQYLKPSAIAPNPDTNLLNLYIRNIIHHD